MLFNKGEVLTELNSTYTGVSQRHLLSVRLLSIHSDRENMQVMSLFHNRGNRNQKIISATLISRGLNQKHGSHDTSAMLEEGINLMGNPERMFHLCFYNRFQSQLKSFRLTKF